MAKTINKEQLHTIELTGEVQPVNFGVRGKAFKIKNWSDDNIYVSFSDTVSSDKSMRIASMMEDTLVVNVDETSDTVGNATVYVLGAGTGKVQVQAIWF